MTGAEQPGWDGDVGRLTIRRLGPADLDACLDLAARRQWLPRFGHRGLGRRLMMAALDHAGSATVFRYATTEGRPLYTELPGRRRTAP